MAAMCAAPVMPFDPPATSTVPDGALVVQRTLGDDETRHRPPP